MHYRTALTIIVGKILTLLIHKHLIFVMFAPSVWTIDFQIGQRLRENALHA